MKKASTSEMMLRPKAHQKVTILLASDEQPNPLTVDSARVCRTTMNGVHTFVRTYELR